MDGVSARRYLRLVKKLGCREHTHIETIRNNFIDLIVQTSTVIGAVTLGDKGIVEADDNNRRLFNSTLVWSQLNWFVIIEVVSTQHFFNILDIRRDLEGIAWNKRYLINTRASVFNSQLADQTGS